MSDLIMTPMLGKWRAYTDGTVTGGTLGLVILRSISLQADADLRTHTTLAAMLAAGNVEANWSTGTPYARKFGITATGIPGVAQYAAGIPDQTFLSAGTFDAPQPLAKAVLCWYPTGSVGVNSAWLPLAFVDWPEVANGASITVDVNASGLLLTTG